MIALIAGTGTLPVLACQALKNQQQPFFVLSLFPEINGDALRTAVTNSTQVIIQSHYRPAEIIEILKKNNTTHVIMLGKVDKKCLLQKIKLDWLGVKLLASIVYKNDTTIMEKIVTEFANHGIQVMRQDKILPGLLVKPGILTGNVTDELQIDISLGIKTVQSISQIDIGQTVIIKNNMILAVEAIEGTDECIKRGIKLGDGNIVVCKGARHDQNRKFDLPTLGPQSLSFLKKGDVQAFAWLSATTLIAQQDEFIALAKQLQITLVSV